ncbi:PAS domain S-box protein [Sinobaca sp. H24]|uniref:PAS domain S-box protein n=1 Tax=Sinobaca sp. H24 TaxID=2923376 RepID=UPI0020791F38|nr:PAS domain S-box protein [Sinobaca sp. H24]
MHFSDIVLSEGYLPAGSMSLLTLKTYYYDHDTCTLPVLEKEKVVNILSLSDLESSGLPAISSGSSADPIICAHPEDLLETYVDLKQSILPVVGSDGTYAGFISLLHLRQILQVSQSLRSKQKHLEEINEEYEMILETSHDVVQVTDEKGTTLRMSRSSETIDGISPSQLLGKSMKEMVDQSLYSKSAAMEVLKLQKPVTITQSVNNDKEVLATGTPFFKDGRLYRVVVNARDITELNKLRNEVKKVEYIKEELQMLRSKTLALPDTVVKNKKMQNIFSIASRVADVDSTILLFGESGVGRVLSLNIFIRTAVGPMVLLLK